MTIQFDVTLRNARADVIESHIGASPILRIYDLTAGAPANCAAAITGTILAEITLPSNWLADAASGTKILAGTWSDTSANNGGTPEFFRIFDSTDTICHIQGTVTETGNGGDITVDNDSVNAGQQFNITGFTLTEGNA